MATTPYTAATLAALDSDIAFRCYAVGYGSSWGNTELTVLDGSVTIDEYAQPYVQGTLVVADPPAGVNFDPRQYPRMRLFFVYVHPDGTVDGWVPTGPLYVEPSSMDVGIADAERDERSGVWTLTLASDEVLAQESRQWSVSTITTTYASYRAALVDA